MTGGPSQLPGEVVAAFIKAMNEWEVSSWEASRRARGTANPGSYWPEVTAALDRVFEAFCTPRERPQGRQASFQKPPEYDPSAEQILGSEIAGDKAYVDTERKAVFGGGLLRYALQRRHGKWMIDNVKRKDGEEWARALL
ncbi:MAG: NTF2 fold immunity protein [Vicinamibacteria bacterium]